MTKDKIILGAVNPLIFIKADDRFHFGETSKLTPEDVLRYLCSETMSVELQDIKQRYATIAKNATHLFIVPAEAKILMKIVYPLKHAIGSYIIGNYLETIALCGTVAEMIAMFLFEISELTIQGKPTSNEAETQSSLQEFERWRQSDRIRKLKKFGLIDSETKRKFNTVGRTRNEYLHSISKNYDNIALDAKEVFDATLEIFLSVTQLGIQEGKTIMNQNMLDSLTKKGRDVLAKIRKMEEK